MKTSEQKKLHCLILVAILPLAQCVSFSLVNCCTVQLKLIQHCYVLPHLFKTPGNLLNSLTEIGLVDELRLCFKDDSFFSKECGTVPQSYGDMTAVHPRSSQVSKQYISILMMFATQKKDNYCLSEVDDLNFSIVILHSILHTYSVGSNVSKWRYILFSLLGWNFFLEFATF